MVSTIWVQEAKMDTFPVFYLIVCSSSCSICDGTKWAITKTMKVIPVELKMIANLQHTEISLFRTGWYTNIIGKCLLLFLVFFLLFFLMNVPQWLHSGFALFFMYPYNKSEWWSVGLLCLWWSCPCQTHYTVPSSTTCFSLVRIQNQNLLFILKFCPFHKI